jgi:predicted small metal-binding protein
MARKHQGKSGSGRGESGRQQGQQGDSGKRYTMDCRESGQGCTLMMSGSMEEVMMTAEMHARKAHGLRGTEEEMRRQLRDSIKEEGVSERPKAGVAGGGQRNEERQDMPPA